MIDTEPFFDYDNSHYMIQNIFYYFCKLDLKTFNS